MASGDTLFILLPHGSVPTPTAYATLDTIADTSTPALTIPVLDFDGATDEHAEWYRVIPSQYAGTTGFTFQYYYATDGADADLVEIEFRVLHIDDLDVLTGDLGIDTQTAVAIQDTPPATHFIVIRATRDISAATNTDDLQLAAVLVKET
jgi:hypothetical protein